MIRRKKAGSRRGRAALAGAIAATAVMAFGATSANAATAVFSASFDDAALNLPNLGTFDILTPPPPATMTGTVADDTQDPASFTVPQAGFVFPPFTGNANGLPVTVEFEATAPITGAVSPITGSVATAASAYKLTLSSPFEEGPSCVYDLTRSFTTGSGSPFNGDPFTVDKTTTLGTWSLSQGILQTGWASLPASGCGELDAIVASGPGGLEVGNGFDLTPPPPPATPAITGSIPSSPANNNQPHLTGTTDPGTTIKLYENSSCSGSPVAEGLDTEFTGSGIQVTVADDTTTAFYATATATEGTGTSTSACSTPAFTYIEDSSVATPILVRTEPPSGSNNNSPRFLGIAESGTVRLYRSAVCSGSPTASDTAASFAAPGILVSVPDNSTTTLYAQVTDQAGNVSTCSAPLTYVESTPPPSTGERAAAIKKCKKKFPKGPKRKKCIKKAKKLPV